jgi:hypothetical protein
MTADTAAPAPTATLDEAGAQISPSKLAGARGRIVRPHSTLDRCSEQLGIR